MGAEQSGFISEIGFEMYHKILNEAIEELKQTEFKELFLNEENETLSEGTMAKECNIETDLEVLIPDSYVSSTVERLNLYKELDGLITDKELEEFASGLKDRFGALPSKP